MLCKVILVENKSEIVSTPGIRRQVHMARSEMAFHP